MKSKKHFFSIATYYKYFMAIQGEKVEISDEDFFQILKHHPDFLQSSVAIERICLWQGEINRSDSKASFMAEKKLKKIGTILALKKRRTKLATEKKNALIEYRRRVFNKIKPAGISKYRSIASKKIKLKELFPPTLVDKLPDCFPESDTELTNMISAKYFGYEISTVERYIKGYLKEGLIRLSQRDTKTRQARTIPLNDEVWGLLVARKRDRDLNIPDMPFVFYTPDGEPIESFRKAWITACKKTGLKGKLFHDFRRTGVRNMVRSGVPEVVAMAISGHRTRSVFDRYNIVSEADLRLAAWRVDTYTKAKMEAESPFKELEELEEKAVKEWGR